MFNTLSREQLHYLAPSIFTEGQAERTSDKYQHISSISILDKLSDEGFVPVSSQQSNVRLANRKSYAKHLIRLRHQNARPTQSGLYPEIVLVNSHDGLSSYRLMSGLFRMVCANGLIVGSTHDEVRVRHLGDITGNVIEGTYRVIDTAQQTLSMVGEMESKLLSVDEKLSFAERAHELRFAESDNLMVNAQSLLRPKRAKDQNSDLFTTFNVIQENLIRGGLVGIRHDNRGRRRYGRSREVKSIDRNVAINQKLWQLSLEYLK